MMYNELNTYEKKGINEYKNKKWLWKALFAANELYECIVNNMDEIPDIQQQDLYMFVNTLLEVKYKILELIGRN